MPAILLMSQRQLIAINNPCASAVDTVQAQFARAEGGLTSILTVNK